MNTRSLILMGFMSFLWLLPGAAYGHSENANTTDQCDAAPGQAPLMHTPVSNPDAGTEPFDAFVKRKASLEVQVGLALYRQRDDYRAITSLKRYQILDRTPEAQFLSALMLGKIYTRNDKPELAVKNYEYGLQFAPTPEDAVHTYLLAMQELCLSMSVYFECRQRLAELGQTELPVEQRELVDYQRLYTDVVLRSPYVASFPVDQFQNEALRTRAHGLIARDQQFYDLKLQKPWLAGSLSAVLPGAGQMYNGRWTDGIIALSFNALFGAATYYSFASLKSIPLGIVSALFTAGFYSGNIVNAVTDAQRINAQTYRQFFEDLKDDYWPQVDFGIQSNTVHFFYRFDWNDTPD